MHGMNGKIITQFIIWREYFAVIEKRTNKQSINIKQFKEERTCITRI